MSCNKTFINVILVCVVCTLVYTIYFLRNTRYTDTAYFGGDTWEYQSMAVNWISGHGLSFGGYEPFKLYNFTKEGSDVTPEGEKNFLSYYQKSPLENFYRVPGYPIFLGLIYKIFGIHPAIVKQIQMLMLITIAGFLPLIGWYYWKKQGVISGVTAGIIFLKTYTVAESIPNITHPSDILTEPLITFVIFLIIISTIYWKANKTLGRSLLLGSVIGISTLVKGSNIFIPVLYTLLLIFEWLKKSMNPVNILFLILGIAIFTIPWSVYASVKTRQLVVLSTQGSNALLDTNNEYTSDGLWHPEGYSYSVNNYYRQPWIQKYPDPVKVILFYWQHPTALPVTMFHKIDYAFSYFPCFIIIILLMIYFQITDGGKSQIFRQIALIPLLYYIIRLFISPMQITLINRTQPIIWLYHSPVLLLILVLISIFNRIRGRKSIVSNIPIELVILFLNFFLISVIIFGLTRYIQVIDFIFILVAIRYLLFLGEIYFNHAKNY